MKIEYLTLGIQLLTFLVLTAFGLPAARKALEEVRYLLRARRRAECEFALKLADISGDPSIKRHAIELGYAALVGDRQLTHKQRAILLSRQDSERASDLYKRSRKLVEIDDRARCIRWRTTCHKSTEYRRRIKLVWGGVYAGCIVLSLVPWWLGWLHEMLAELRPEAKVALQVYGTVAFLVAAIGCLGAVIRLREAEQLVQLPQRVTRAGRKRRASPPRTPSPPHRELRRDTGLTLTSKSRACGPTSSAPLARRDLASRGPT